MKVLSRVVVAVGIALVLLGASSAAFGSVLLVRFDPPVPGESKLPGYQNWIEASLMGHEVVNITGAAPDTGYLTIMKQIDRASVLLAFYAVSGRVFSSVTIEVLGTYGALVPEFRIELMDPRIILVRPNISDKQSQEEVVLDGYSRVTWTYFLRKSDGTLIGKVIRSVPGT